MRRLALTAIAALGIGVATNVFANAAGTQVNPSTINLSAAGVTDVGIHTQLPADTPVSCVHIVDSTLKSFDISELDLTLGSDSLGHLVISIDVWAESVAPLISTGEAIFEIYGSEGCGSDLLAVDTANVVDNSGRQN